jgi:hypothetical protein
MSLNRKEPDSNGGGFRPRLLGFVRAVDDRGPVVVPVGTVVDEKELAV